LEGPLPRLTYVTDAGENETQYYRRVLGNMAHPRTGEKLPWIRIVDYYHAAQRIWAMAEALFGKDDRAGVPGHGALCRSAKLPPLCSDKLPCYLERSRGLPSSK